MRYVIARHRQNQRDMAYRIYVTKCLRILTVNTATPPNGMYMTQDFSDVIRRKPVDNRVGEEIAADVIKKAGLVVKE